MSRSSISRVGYGCSAAWTTRVAPSSTTSGPPPMASHGRRSGNAAWPVRGGQTLVVYRDRLWLFGGANHIADDRSPDGFLNDVWVSDDGISWTRVTEAAPWSPRDKAGVVVFKDELYLLGGQGTADVWRSSNGRDWIHWWPRPTGALAMTSPGSPTTAGYGCSAAGGTGPPMPSMMCGPPRDGTSWSRQTDHAPWAPRSPISVVFHDKIWIYSGKHTGADDNWGGDVWQMITSGVAAR